MAAEVVQLKRLTICPCGYGVLKDEISVGTEYTIDRARAFRGEYRCGRCGTRQVVLCVPASSALNPEQGLAPLPLELFAESS